MRGGFFETLHLSLIHISKLTLRALKDLLQPHSLDEADKMANIRPDLLHNLREVLAAKQLKSASQAMISQTTKKFNSTQTKIKSQQSALALNLAALPKVKAPYLPPPKLNH